ncbi:hypothetical protein ACHAXM_009793 [Skeletonema potamos]
MAESQKENQCAASVGSGISDLTMPSSFHQQRFINSRSSLTGESPSSLLKNRKPPPESSMRAAKQTKCRQQQSSPSQHYEHPASSQSSREKIREDVNIQYRSKKHEVATNNSTAYANVDQDLESALLASQEQYDREEQNRIPDEKVQLEWAMKEALLGAASAAAESPPLHQQHTKQCVVEDEVILIDDDDDLNTKISAKRRNLSDDALEDKKMPANNTNNEDQDEEDDIQKAIRLSLQEQNIKPSIDDDDDFNCRVLSRKEFEDIIYPLVEMQGGFAKIEKGKLVQTGNAHNDVKNGKSQSRGKSQSKAQYGRYMIEDFWTVLDTLEGKMIDTTDDNKSVNDESCREIDSKQEEGEQKKRPCSQLGSKITAFTDIGHGIGIQVMQAGWTLDVCSRGIELMKGRHEIAEAIREGVIDELRSDPPDSTKVELRLGNLVHCVQSPPNKSYRDEELRRFVLFQDKPESIQRGLVIFANNAEDVFAARSNDSGSGACLDEHLAELFGNMKVGGKCVTLTDIRLHLTSNDDARWYHYESFDSGVGAVSWSPNKSLAVHVLTKISDEWICSNTKNVVRCPPSNVVNVETGKLTTVCICCLTAPRRQQQRNRKKRRIYSPEEGD